MDYFVSQEGNDEWRGDAERPWRSLDKANASVQPGDTVHLLPGRHAGVLLPARSGEPGKPITYRAAQRRRAVLVGDPSHKHVIVLRGRRHVKLDGLVVSPGTKRWLDMNRSDHVSIHDCRMEKSGTDYVSASIVECEDLRVTDSIFSRDRPTGNMLYLRACSRVLIEGNSITRTGHSPLRVEACQFAVIRANCFHNGWGRPYELVASGRLLVEGNVITEAYDSAHSADTRAKNAYADSIFRFNRVYGNRHTPLNSPSYFPMVGSATGYVREPFRLVNSRIYHNTIADNIGYGWETTGLNISSNLFENNIFWRNDWTGGGVQLSIGKGVAGDNRFLHNLMRGPEPGQHVVLFEGDYRTAEEANAKGRYYRGVWREFAGNTDADPAFTDPGHRDYRLTASSAGIDAGCALTCAVGGGKGRDLRVSDGACFYDGFGIEGEGGDWIAVGSGDNVARILAITRNYYQGDVLHLDRDMTWRNGAPVSLPWSGKAPDLGAYERGGQHPSRLVATASAAAPEPGETVSFAIDTFGKDLAAIRWDLGDGHRSAEPRPTHAYEEPGMLRALVRARFTDGGSGIDVVHLRVATASEPGAPMLELTFEDEDIEDWGHVFKFHRQRHTVSRRVEGGYGGGKCQRIEAEKDGAILGARLYPGEWDIDRYPRVRFAYRAASGVPVGLCLEAPAMRGRDTRIVMIGGTPTRRPGPYPDTDTYTLQDDDEWHTVTVDVRAIRGHVPDIKFIRGFRFYTHNNAKRGQAFLFDEFAVLP